MKTNYVYKRPKGKLYKVSIRKWNKVFNNRGTWPFVIAEVYLDGETASVQFVIGKVGYMLLILLLPILFVQGVLAVGVSETVDDIKSALFQRKYGSFSSDMLYKQRHKLHWNKLMEMIGEDT